MSRETLSKQNLLLFQDNRRPLATVNRSTRAIRFVQVWTIVRGKYSQTSPITCAAAASIEDEGHGVRVFETVFRCLVQVCVATHTTVRLVRSGECCLSR